MNRHQSGFTLIELAVVLCILALLAGGLLMPLSAEVEQQKLRATREELENIRQALLGHALLYGILPCPASTSDPASADYGVAVTSCSTAPSTEGYLPWKTLGTVETDAWDAPWRYRVDRNFVGAAISLSTNFSADALSVRDSRGNTLTTTTERPVVIVYSTGPNLHADGHNASFEASGGIYQSDAASPAFDDLTLWLSRPQLLERLVAAGRLP